MNYLNSILFINQFVTKLICESLFYLIVHQQSTLLLIMKLDLTDNKSSNKHMKVHILFLVQGVLK